ncbi:MAG: hypothetical protein DRG78_05165 [Epsilonproteobacteria bacterium]|nr:MAG: hypothetical protein DRG78_05165 [Campylobacterota bacterium]
MKLKENKTIRIEILFLASLAILVAQLPQLVIAGFLVVIIIVSILIFYIVPKTEELLKLMIFPKIAIYLVLFKIYINIIVSYKITEIDSVSSESYGVFLNYISTFTVNTLYIYILIILLVMSIFKILQDSKKISTMVALYFINILPGQLIDKKNITEIAKNRQELLSNKYKLYGQLDSLTILLKYDIALNIILMGLNCIYSIDNIGIILFNSLLTIIPTLMLIVISVALMGKDNILIDEYNRYKNVK